MLWIWRGISNNPIARKSRNEERSGYSPFPSLCLLLSVPAWAGSQLYTNGPIDGQDNDYILGNPYGVADSFTLGSASMISSISFGDWVYIQNNMPSTVIWSITSAPFGGTVFAGGTSSLTSTLYCSWLQCGYGFSNVFSSTFSSALHGGGGRRVGSTQKITHDLR